MWRALVVTLLLAGCIEYPPIAEDIQAKRFEPVPDKAVIYIVRDHVGTDLDLTLRLGDSGMINTYTGRYYRWEVAPGTHHITGTMESTASITLNVEAGKIYFVRHGVVGSDASDGVQWSYLQRVDERVGRATVARGVLQ
jgi:uncharacterized protein DUF2846